MENEMMMMTKKTSRQMESCSDNSKPRKGGHVLCSPCKKGVLS